MSRLGQEKSRQALAFVPKDDAWIFVTREGSDPGARLVFDAAVSGEAAFVLRPGRGALALVANYDAGHVERLGVFDEIRSYDRSFASAFTAWLRELAPATVHLNYSERDILCDGLTHGQYLRTTRLLREALPGVAVASSEPLPARGARPQDRRGGEPGCARRSAAAARSTRASGASCGPA